MNYIKVVVHADNLTYYQSAKASVRYNYGIPLDEAPDGKCIRTEELNTDILMPSWCYIFYVIE